jgi:hypothetical protein
LEDVAVTAIYGAESVAELNQAWEDSIRLETDLDYSIYAN